MSILDPAVQEQFLVRVRVELFAAAQVMRDERLDQLRTLLHEVLSIMPSGPYDETKANVEPTPVGIGRDRG